MLSYNDLPLLCVSNSSGIDSLLCINLYLILSYMDCTHTAARISHRVYILMHRLCFFRLFVCLHPFTDDPKSLAVSISLPPRASYRSLPPLKIKSKVCCLFLISWVLTYETCAHVSTLARPSFSAVINLPT